MSIRPNDRLNYIILFLKNWIARKPQWGVVKPQRVVFFHIEYHIGVWYYPCIVVFNFWIASSDKIN